MRFEYKVVTLKSSIWNSKPEKTDNSFQERLNQLGMVGWELVDVIPHGHWVRCFLKRVK